MARDTGIEPVSASRQPAILTIELIPHVFAFPIQRALGKHQIGGCWDGRMTVTSCCLFGPPGGISHIHFESPEALCCVALPTGFEPVLPG